MPNAFYRNTSSSAKKKSERERRQSAQQPYDEAAEQVADVPVSEDAPKKRQKAELIEVREDRAERSLLTWNMTVTPSAVVTASVLGMILLAFTFLSGVIVGRGTMPLPQALELEKLAPEDPVQADMTDRILSQEELKFMTSLKARESEGVLSAARETGKDGKNSKTSKEARTAKAAKDARAEKEARASRARVEAARREAERKAEKSSAQKSEQKAAQKSAVFDYVLRVAAFKEPAPAQRLVERLSKEGMRAQRHIGRSITGELWHYVSVPMRGTVEDLQVTRRKLDKFGLRDAMVISKKAVEQKKQTRGAAKRQ